MERSQGTQARQTMGDTHDYRCEMDEKRPLLRGMLFRNFPKMLLEV